MKLSKWNILWGVLMVVGGGLLLLEALGVSVTGPVWSVLFAVAGVAFLYAFVASRENWWAAIPAGALLGLTALIAWSEFTSLSDDWGASLFLGGIGTGFWAVYLRSRERWWAIIPGGALLTIALVTGLSSTVGGMAISAVFFLGLALTFALLAVLPTEEGQMRWPVIPAAVLGVLGGLFAIGAAEVLNALNYLWPAALIAGGLYLIFHAFGSGRRPRPHA